MGVSRASDVCSSLCTLRKLSRLGLWAYLFRLFILKISLCNYVNSYALPFVLYCNIIIITKDLI